MPNYDYECANCRRLFEVVHGVHVPGPTSCPLCGGGPVRKAISAPAVHFKGSGWAKKERRAAAPSSKKDTSDGGKGPDEAARTSSPTKTVATETSGTSGTTSPGSKPAPADPGGD